MEMLRDFQCEICGNITENYTENHINNICIYCKNCMQVTNHNVIINGGIKSRWLYMDFNFDNDREVRKHIRLGKSTVKDKLGRDLVDMRKGPNYQKKISDIVKENHEGCIERKVHEIEIKKGRRPIYKI